MKPRKDKHLLDNWYCEIIIHDNNLVEFFTFARASFPGSPRTNTGVLNFNSYIPNNYF